MRPVGAATRACAAAVALAVCLDGAATLHGHDGLSSFGRPAWLAWPWALGGLASALWILRNTDRRALAGCLSLLLLSVGLFGQAALPAAPGLGAALAGIALWVAGPWIRMAPGLAATTLAMALAAPACLASTYPLGVTEWLAAALPAAALVALLPACFPGDRARIPAWVLVGATGSLCVAALTDYVPLAEHLHLPLTLLRSTRLRPMSLHPNLAVPSVAVALLVGAGLVWSTGRRRLAATLALAPLLLALFAMGSKTGSLASVAGLACLLALRARWPLARAVPWVLRAAVLAALLVPATGLSDPTITERSASMVSKAVSFRSAMWRLGRDTAAAAPWHGFGPRTNHVQAAYARPGRYDGLPKDDHPHNVVLAVSAALGWPGWLGLAALLVASLWRRPGARMLADATLVAAAVHWGADGVDMGGAVASLFPSGVLLLIGLGDAAVRAPDHEPHRRAAGARVLGALGIVLVAGGGLLALQHHLVRTADARVNAALAANAAPSTGPPTAAAGPATAPASEPTDLIAWAGRLLPWDPRPWILRARLARLAGDVPAQIEAFEQALMRSPDRADWLHALALLHSQADLDDGRVAQLLDRALALDPYGPDAWRRHIDRALLAAHRDDGNTAFEQLVLGALLNPGAVTGLGWIPERRTLRLRADGTHGIEIPLARLFAELQRRRSTAAGIDPAYDARLRLREIEILIALGELDEADATCRELLANEPVYLNVRLGQSALQRGDFEAAVHHMGLAGQTLFEPLSTRLVALAQLLDPATDAFERELSQALRLLPDVSFEAGSIRRVVEARRDMAQRRGDDQAVAREDAALAFLDR